jgi:hypothetical protein
VRATGALNKKTAALFLSANTPEETRAWLQARGPARPLARPLPCRTSCCDAPLQARVWPNADLHHLLHPLGVI